MSHVKTLDASHAIKDMGDDQQLYREIVSVYLDDTPKIFDQIKHAIQTNDMECLIRNVHSLKSSSRTIGGIMLGEVAAELEQQLNDGKTAAIGPMIALMQQEFEKLKAALMQEGYEFEE